MTLKKFITQMLIETKVIGLFLKVKLWIVSRFNSSCFRLLKEEEVDLYKYRHVFPEDYVKVIFPKTNEILDGGCLYLYHPSCQIYRFTHCIQHASSDAIRVGNGVYFIKSSRPASNKEIFSDRDFLSITPNELKLLKSRNHVSVGRAFSLLGVHSAHWAHFLAEFYPKLVFTKDTFKHVDSVVVNGESDDHILKLIESVLPSNIKVVKVKESDFVHFEEMIYCSAVSYLCNHAHYTSVTDTVIPGATRKAIRLGLLNHSNSIRTVLDPNKVNLFIAYNGPRGAVNNSEVERYFVDRGYHVVHPHLLSFDDKVSLFSNASRVVGIGSSGFTNILFSVKESKVLWFMNYERALGTYLSQFSEDYPDIQFFTFVGTRVGKWGIHSSYHIDLNKLSKYLDENGF